MRDQRDNDRGTNGQVRGGPGKDTRWGEGLPKGKLYLVPINNPIS